VLKDFSKSELAWALPLIDAIAASAPLLAKDDTANFMNDVARAVGGETPGTKPKAVALQKKPVKSDKVQKPGDKPKQTGPFARLRSLFGTEKQ
jgi:hypothetical protein